MNQTHPVCYAVCFSLTHVQLGMGGIAFLKNGTVLEKIPRYH